MLTGKEAWSSKIDASHGWEDVYGPDSSSLIISANGLQYINMADGLGWSCPLETEAKTRGKIENTITYYRPPVMVHMASRASSNICAANNSYFLAGRDEMVSVNKQGRLLWRRTLPYTSGTSVIWADSERIYMVAKGYVTPEDDVVFAGTTYLAAFNILDGSLLYATTLKKNTIVGTIQVLDGVALLLCDKEVATFDLKAGYKKAYAVITSNDKVFSDFVYDIYGSMTSMGDAAGRSLREMYPGEFFLVYSNYNILRVDKMLNDKGIVAQRSLSGIYVLDRSLKMKSALDSTVIYKNDVPVLKLDGAGWKYVQKRLVKAEGNRLTVVDPVGL